MTMRMIGRGVADRLERRQHADQRGGAAHDDQRHEERVLPPDQVADATEEQRPERADDEPDREGHQVDDQREQVVARRVKQRRDDRGERPEDVEVVPLDHRPRGGGGDHLPDAVVVLDLRGRSRGTGLCGSGGRDLLAHGGEM